jgi:VanZ family protein
VKSCGGFFMIKLFLKNNPYKLAAAWALLIFALCSMPGRFIPTASWLELLSFDKWVHAGIFFILVSLFCLGVMVHGQSFYFILLFCFCSIVYGGLLEIMQAKVFSERSADWQDFVANSFGCLMALLFHKKIVNFILK